MNAVTVDHFSQPTPTQKVIFEYERQKYEIYIKRDDLIHPVVSGNKWRKLRYHPCFSDDFKAKCLVTMGGGYSNLVFALAYLAQWKGLKLKVFTSHRGEDTYLMDWCVKMGTEFIVVSRTAMRELREGKISPTELVGDSEELEWIPEGGGGNWSVRGVSEMVEEVRAALPGRPLRLAVAAGTGITSSIIASLLPAHAELFIFPSVRSRRFDDFVKREIESKKKKEIDFQLLPYGVDKGMGNIEPEVVKFLYKFYIQTGILLDPFYNGKVLFALAKNQLIDGDAPLVLIHSGGAQTWIGLSKKYPDNSQIHNLAAVYSKKLHGFFN
nr:pyridoxal-phosphate dependent enzyme [Saprospiraceae bacterium]